MINTKTIFDTMMQFHSLLTHYRRLVSVAYIEAFVWQHLKGSELPRVLFAGFVLGFPFLLPYIYGYLAIPPNYTGVRNEESGKKDGDDFKLDKVSL